MSMLWVNYTCKVSAQSGLGARHIKCDSATSLASKVLLKATINTAKYPGP
jgi:hypothetical protein